MLSWRSRGHAKNVTDEVLGLVKDYKITSKIHNPVSCEKKIIYDNYLKKESWIKKIMPAFHSCSYFFILQQRIYIQAVKKRYQNREWISNQSISRVLYKNLEFKNLRKPHNWFLPCRWIDWISIAIGLLKLNIRLP